MAVVKDSLLQTMEETVQVRQHYDKTFYGCYFSQHYLIIQLMYLVEEVVLLVVPLSMVKNSATVQLDLSSPFLEEPSVLVCCLIIELQLHT